MDASAHTYSIIRLDHKHLTLQLRSAFFTPFIQTLFVSIVLFISICNTDVKSIPEPELSFWTFYLKTLQLACMSLAWLLRRLPISQVEPTLA